MTPHSPPRRARSTRPGAAVRAAGTGLALVLLGAGIAAPAAAAAGEVGSLTATPTTDLPAQGAVVTVTGTGFDPLKGIYVAVCVDNGPGEKPSPCLGGVDTEGTGGATWISDNPPSYAEGLTEPWGPDGSFTVELPVVAQDPVTGVDCFEVTCAVVTRYDHTRGDDRGADHAVALTFASGEPSPTPTPTPSEPEPSTAEPAASATPEASTPAAEAPGTTAEESSTVPGGLIGGAGALISLLAALAVAVVVVRRRAASDAADPDESAGPPDPGDPPGT